MVLLLLLLVVAGSIQAHLVHAHQQQQQRASSSRPHHPQVLPAPDALGGLNARCISNLIWSLVRLDVTAEGAPGDVCAVLDAACPLVQLLVGECSGQGLANLLWSFAKIPGASPEVLICLVSHMVAALDEPSKSEVLDAQVHIHADPSIVARTSCQARVQGQCQHAQGRALTIQCPAKRPAASMHCFQPSFNSP